MRRGGDIDLGPGFMLCLSRVYLGHEIGDDISGVPLDHGRDNLACVVGVAYRPVSLRSG